MNDLVNLSNIALRKTQYDEIILDGSGSMQRQWWDTLKSIDAYVETLGWDQLDTQLRLSIFTTGHDNIDLIARDCPISQWVPLLKDPPGSPFLRTPLYDAINLMGRRLAKLDPERAAVTIASDGEENGSMVTSLTQARAVLDWCRAKGWQVTLLGVDFNNSMTAEALGFGAQSATGVQRALMSDAMQSIAHKRARYGKTGEQMHFSDDERTQFGGYLNAPKE
jgi:hypothetical protein